jgi:hypothetical protein
MTISGSMIHPACATKVAHDQATGNDQNTPSQENCDIEVERSYE